MKTSLVMTVLREDRPGLVEELSAAIAAHGGNWAESRMASLAGQFAGILRIEIDAAQAPALRAALERLRHDGFVITIHTGSAQAPAGDRSAVRLQVLGHDQPGIVKRITAIVRALNINIDELETEFTAAPHSAEPLFKACALLAVPPGVSLDALRDDLERLSADLMVDIKLD
jgi:glycine cleavage system regulatory protein